VNDERPLTAEAFHDAWVERGMRCDGTHAIGEALCQNVVAVIAGAALRAEASRDEGLRDIVRRALTSEDEVAHGEAIRGGWTEDPRSRDGMGVCAYCDAPWPCRTQQGIDRLLGIVNLHSRDEGDDFVKNAARLSTPAFLLRTCDCDYSRGTNDGRCVECGRPVYE
jgi:hypothetical protein